MPRLAYTVPVKPWSAERIGPTAYIVRSAEAAVIGTFSGSNARQLAERLNAGGSTALTIRPLAEAKTVWPGMVGRA